MTLLQMLAATILSLAKTQINKFKWDFQRALPDCDVQLLLADADSYGVVINHYDYRQNEKFREYIDRQIYKNPSSRRWLDYSNLVKMIIATTLRMLKKPIIFKKKCPLLITFKKERH